MRRTLRSFHHLDPATRLKISLQKVIVDWLHLVSGTSFFYGIHSVTYSVRRDPTLEGTKAKQLVLDEIATHRNRSEKQMPPRNKTNTQRLGGNNSLKRYMKGEPRITDFPH